MLRPRNYVKAAFAVFIAVLIHLPVSGLSHFPTSPLSHFVTLRPQGPLALGVSAVMPPEAFAMPLDSAVGDDPDGVLMLTPRGRPEMPYLSRCILIPPTGGVRLADVRTDSRVERQLRLVAPEFSESEAMVTDLPEDADGFWPAQPVILGEPAVLRGCRIVTVMMFPLQVNVTTGEVRRNERIDFSLAFDGTEVNPVVHPERLRPSIYLHQILRGLVVNPPPAPRRDDLQSGGYLYVVPEFNGVDNDLAPLIEWRRRQGHNITVAHVANNAAAGDVLQIIRDAYAADPPVEFVTLVGDASGGDFNVPAASRDGDWNYTRLDGNDPLPDVALGRISCRNLSQLRRIVNKLVSYEANPYVANTDWFRHGAVVAGSSINGISEVFVAKYVRKELLALGFDEVRHWYWPDDGDAGGNQEFLTAWFRWGISVLHYRAYQYMNGLPINVIDQLPNRDGRWPAVLAISCDTGDFTATDGRTEAFLRAEGGGIGAIGTATPETNVKFNNLMAGGVWKGIYKDQLYAFGWGLNMGKFELWRAFDGLDNNYLGFLDWNNLMGDAGTHIWTGAPRRIRVTAPQALSLGSSRCEVVVQDDATRNPEPDALVCLYKRDELHLTRYTDESGRVVLAMDPAALSPGDLLVTVTKHNVRAYLGTIAIRPSEQHYAVEEWSLEGGDGDDIPNPGEDLTLNLAIHNYGNQGGGNSLAVWLESETPLVEVTGDSAEIGRAPDPGASAPVSLRLTVSRDCPDGAKLPMKVVVSQGNSIWLSEIEPVAEAPLLVVQDVAFENGGINPGDVTNVNLQILNAGHKASAAFTATLRSAYRDLIVHQDEAGYDLLEVGEAAWARGQLFRIAANWLVIPGQRFGLDLAAAFEGGGNQSFGATITVGRPGDRDPLGPDEYGYICFDSGDTSWQMAPVFDWIEIDPDAPRPRFEGVRLDISDAGDNEDQSLAIDLPFDFQYYGARFDQITVSTNGWAAFGDQSELADFRNTHIGQALGPRAQLCAWWDNLITPQGSGISTCYDRDGGRFIIEWYHVRRLLTGGQMGAVETFQIILYDTDVMPTPTGDGVITFQYLEVENENQQARNDIPYCTIGIGNLDDSGGLEYTYWNAYPPGARPIGDRMAITFTPTVQLVGGVIRGTVTDLATGQPVRDAIVRANQRGLAVTDNDGRYLLDLVVGEGYQVTAGGPGWNDSTQAGFDVAEHETLTVDFALRHPEFALSPERVESDVDAGRSRAVEVTIRNGGNGPLAWSVEKHVDGEGGDLAGRRYAFPAARRAGDAALAGVAHVGDRFYVTGDNGNGPQLVYIFNEAGALLDTMLRSFGPRGPMPDLTWDGELLWGSGGSSVYGFDLEGRVGDSFRGPFADNQGLAWDSERQLLWICSSQSAFFGVDRDGRAFATLHDYRFRITGLAFWQDDPDGYQLYVLHNPEAEVTRVHKINIDTDDTLFVAELQPPEGGRPGGLEVTPDFGAYDWSLVMLMNDVNDNRGGDRVDVYQLGAVTSWLGFAPDSGVVEADGASPMTVELNAAGLDSGTVNGRLTFTHNAVGGGFELPVRLTVHGLGVGDEGEPTLPGELKIGALWPAPFNAAFAVAYDLPRSGSVEIAVYDVRGREVARPESGLREAGRHTLTVDATTWPSGLYAVRLQAGGIVRTAKIVCIK